MKIILIISYILSLAFNSTYSNELPKSSELQYINTFKHSRFNNNEAKAYYYLVYSESNDSIKSIVFILTFDKPCIVKGAGSQVDCIRYYANIRCDKRMLSLSATNYFLNDNFMQCDKMDGSILYNFKNIPFVVSLFEKICSGGL